MGFFSKSLGFKAFSPEDPTQPLIPSGAILDAMSRTDAGVVVNEKQAMRLATVYACVKVISEDLSSCSFAVWETQRNQSEREATEHRCYPLLHDQPNPNQSSMIFREAMIVCALIYGNGYVYINRDKAARPVSLILLPPDKTKPVVVDGVVNFLTTATPDSAPKLLPGANVIHVPMLSFDGITGISPIRNAMQSVGLAIAAERFGSNFFGNGARASGVFTHPGVLDEEAYQNLKSSIREMATGDNAMRPIILEEGLKWEQVTIPPEEAQFLETRKFQKAEIASLYRVPLHKINELDRSTNNNIEHQSIEYVQNLRPLAVRIEQEFNRKLLSAPFHSAHDLNDLLRGDFATQCEGFAALRNIGVYSANDIRRRLRENPIAASQGGDVYLAPLNTTSLAQFVKGAAPAVDPSGAPADEAEADPAEESAASVRRGRFN